MPIEMDATNEMDSFQLFLRRLLYDLGAYPSQMAPALPTGIKNYWFLENTLYGKVDPNFVGVEPLVQGMIQVEGQNGSVYVLDFVAEAFDKFQQFFVMPLRTGRLEEGTPLSKPLPFRGFQNADEIYNNYLNKMMLNFNSEFLSYFNRRDKIYNIKDYCKLFFDFFLNRGKQTLLSKSSFLLSSRVSTLSSGLSIEIADLDPSNDKDKIEFINLTNFSFYREAAINAGFLIDKNIPWRMNIDLSSPVIEQRLQYSKQNNFGTPSNVFSDYFRTSSTQDLEYIKSAILSGYNSFANSRPVFYTSKNCKNIRQPIAMEDLENSLGPRYWIKKYILVKNKEKKYPYTKQEIERIITNSNERLQIGGVNSTVIYINRKFKLPWIQPGSLVYEKLKKEFRETGDFSLDNFSEYVIMLVKKQLNMIY